VDLRPRESDEREAIFNRAQPTHPFYLTASAFLPDPSVARPDYRWADGHCICAPIYPVMISLAMKSVKQSSMSARNQRRGLEHL